MSNPTIETDLAEILKDIRSDQKKLLEEVSNLKVGQAEIKVKVNNIDETVKELKDKQKTLTSDVSSLIGAKSLIVPIIVAVTTSITTLIIRTIPAS